MQGGAASAPEEEGFAYMVYNLWWGTTWSLIDSRGAQLREDPCVHV